MNDHKTLKLDKTLTIVNQRGLHARAAAKFTETISNFSCEVMVSKDKDIVSGNSIMGLLMLAASKGTTIQISMTGVDAERAMQKVIELVDNKFYEEE
jgi:phosphocarrier protein